MDDKEKQELEQPDLSAFTSGMQTEIMESLSKLPGDDKKPEAGKPADELKIEEKKPEEEEKKPLEGDAGKEKPVDGKKEEEDDDDDEFIPLVGKTKKESKKLEGIKIENFDAVSKMFAEAGITLSKEDDLANVVGEIKTLRTRSEELDSENKTLQDYKSVFETLPPDLFAVVETYLNDGDYRKQMVTVSGSFIDFSQDFEKNKVENLIEYYLPGKYSREDLEELADTKEFKLLEGAVRDKFEKDKSELLKKRTDYLNLQANGRKEFAASVSKSVEELEKSQLLDPASLKQVQSVLNTGVNGILGLFIDKNGNITPDGAKKLAYALHGESSVKKLIERATRKGSSNATKEILERGSAESKVKKGKIPEQQVDEKVKEFLGSVIPQSGGNRF